MSKNKLRGAAAREAAAILVPHLRSAQHKEDHSGQNTRRAIRVYDPETGEVIRTVSTAEYREGIAKRVGVEVDVEEGVRPRFVRCEMPGCRNVRAVSPQGSIPKYCVGCRRKHDQEKRREIARRYLARNRDAVLKRRRAARARNREKEIARGRAWREANRARSRESAREYQRARRRSDPDGVRRKQREYKDANREKILEQRRATEAARRAQNRERLREYQREYMRKYRKAKRDKRKARRSSKK